MTKKDVALMRRILTVCMTVVAIVKRLYTAASRATRRFDAKPHFGFSKNAERRCEIGGCDTSSCESRPTYSTDTSVDLDRSGRRGALR
jgi:hypothetical protein